MNKVLKKVLLFVGETILATALWCLLDYFMGDPINLVENIIDVAIIVLLGNITDYLIRKYKTKKSNNKK